jgi:hypothetical protein
MNVEVSGRGVIYGTIPVFTLEGLWKTTKNFRQHNRSPDRDLKLGPSEQEAGVLSTFLSVFFLYLPFPRLFFSFSHSL